MKRVRYSFLFLLVIYGIACSKDKDARNMITCSIDGVQYSFNNGTEAKRAGQYAVIVFGFSGEANANSDRFLLRFDSDTALSPGKYGVDIGSSAGIIKYGALSFLPAGTTLQYISFLSTPTPTELIITAVNHEYIEGTFRGDVVLLDGATQIGRKTITNGKFRAMITD